MNDSSSSSGPRGNSRLSDEQALQLLDLATEVLEGLDELGVTTRGELLDLMDRLERQIADES